jgi:hypothetical protein
MSGMTGERDLGRILAGFSVSRRPGTFVYVVDPPERFADDVVEAVVREREGVTYVVERSIALAAGCDVRFEAVWLTVDVQTSLDGVGLTAAMSGVLASEGVPCNVLAGFHHDHLLVPLELADRAVAALEGLRSPD